MSGSVQRTPLIGNSKVSTSTKSKGPNPNTIADGFSLTDERDPIAGSHMDFIYDDNPKDDGPTNADEDSPDSPDDEPKLHQSHEGEHRGDFGEFPVKVSSKVFYWAFCAAMNSCNLGFDLGVNSDVGPLIQEDFGLSDLQVELFFGSINLFALVGALSSFAITDRFGRRHAFVVSAIHYILGIIIITIAQSYTALMVGRVFMGVGVGFGLGLDPLYIAEISPASRRGELVTWSEIGLNMGILLGFFAGLFFGGLEVGVAWRFMFAMGGIFPSVMIIVAMCYMGESPRWLVSKGKEEKAMKVLKKIYKNDYDVSPILIDMKEGLDREVTVGRTLGWDMILFPTPTFRRMLLVGIAAAIAQQAVGIDAIQYFLAYILDETGIQSRSAQVGILISFCLLKVVFIVIGGKQFDRRGRRSTLFLSLCGMVTALIMLSINFFGGSHSIGLSVFGLAVYLAFYSFGIGPAGWLIPSEVFTTSIRARAMSLATFINRVLATMMASTFLSTANSMSWAGFFFLLALICMAVLVFLYVYLPETKGRSLEDMSVYFAEITGDRRMMETEARITRDRLAVEHAVTTAPRFELPKARDVPREQLPDARVSGTMA